MIVMQRPFALHRVKSALEIIIGAAPRDRQNVLESIMSSSMLSPSTSVPPALGDALIATQSFSKPRVSFYVGAERESRYEELNQLLAYGYYIVHIDDVMRAGYKHRELGKLRHLDEIYPLLGSAFLIKPFLKIGTPKPYRLVFPTLQYY
jgi:hypothetical protein